LPSSPSTFICKSRKLILLIRLKDLKNPYVYPPIDPSLEEIRTEVVESGQKRQIKITGLNGYVSQSSTCDLINQITS